MVESFPPPLSPAGETPTKRCFLTDRQEKRKEEPTRSKKKSWGKRPSGEIWESKALWFPKKVLFFNFFPCSRSEIEETHE